MTEFPGTINISVTRQNVTTCALLSLATYETDVVNYLNTQNLNYELEIENVTACDPQHVNHHFIVGISHKTKTVYIAFRGTDNASDAIQDLKCVQLPGTNFEGNYHKGFLDRAQWLRIEFFLKYLINDYKIICCGHSLGGAVAAIVGLRLIHSPNNNHKRSNIHVVGFGAPMFGCNKVKELVAQYENQFVWFLNEMDIVPASLFLFQRVLAEKPKESKFDLDSIFTSFSNWRKEDKSFLEQAKKFGTNLVSNIDPKTISEAILFVMKSYLPGGGYATAAVSFWKLLEMSVGISAKLISKITMVLLKESKYAMIGKFIILNPNSWSEYKLDQYLPIDETVSSSSELSLCLNGHRMTNYLNKLANILLPRTSMRNRNITDIGEWKIEAIEPDMKEVFSIRTGTMVDLQTSNKNRKVYYTVSDSKITGNQNSFVVKFLSESKLTPLICDMSCEQTNVKVTKINSSNVVEFLVQCQKPPQKEDAFEFTVTYWFGSVTFIHNMFYCRSENSERYEHYLTADPIAVILSAFRSISNYDDQRVLKGHLQSLLSLHDSTFTISSFLENTTFDIKDEKNQHLVDKINSMLKETCDMNGSSWKKWLLIGGVTIAAGVAIIGFALSSFISAPVIVVSALGSAGNSGVAISAGLGLGSILGLGGGTIIGLSGPAAGLIHHIRQKYKNTIESYFNSIKTLLERKNIDISQLRQEIGKVSVYEFDTIEKTILKHKHQLKKENDPVPKFIDIIDCISSIRQTLIEAPLRVGVYVSNPQINWNPLQNMPLFKMNPTHTIEKINNSHIKLIQNGGFDVVIWFIDYANYQSDCSTCKRILEKAMVEPNSIFCLNVKKNDIKVDQELNLVRRELDGVQGALICTNLEQPECGNSIYGIEIIYSFILDRLSKDDCFKYSNLN